MASLSIINGLSSSRARQLNPEGLLSLTSSLSPNGDIDTELNFDTAVPVVFAVDFKGLTASPGYIFEVGGAGSGAYVGFDSNSDFVARCGSGASRWPSATAYILESTNIPDGDGTLVVEFAPGTPITINAWWNGSKVGTPVSGNSSGVWTGTNNAAFLAEQSGANNSVTAGEISTPTSGFTSASNLRYYENQRVTTPFINLFNTEKAVITFTDDTNWQIINDA